MEPAISNTNGTTPSSPIRTPGSTPTAGPSASSGGSSTTSMVKYGEIVILGYNGSLPQGDRGRRRSKFVLFRRQKANGVVRSRHYKVKTPQTSSAVMDSQQHSISYTLSRNQAVIVEYGHDPGSDLFQIGRSSESPIDFVVMDTVPGNRVQDKINSQSTISRFACRIIAEREPNSAGSDDSGRGQSTPKYRCGIYAAGYDSTRNISLGEKATKWESAEAQEVDGLTTNGVLIMHPKAVFCPGPDYRGEVAKPGIWREVSVCGKVFGLRESRSAATQGPSVENEENTLVDGTLIDLCGATLLWRSAEGLKNSPTTKQLEQCLDDMNAGRPQCPVGLHTLVMPSRKNSTKVDPEAQPVVYLNCGHVQGRHAWGATSENGKRTCPICLGETDTAQLKIGSESAFYVDCQPPDYCFVPCGHMSSEKTVKYWANVPIPCGTSGFQSACPFCAVPLDGNPGYVKLIFACD